MIRRWLLRRLLRREMVEVLEDYEKWQRISKQHVNRKDYQLHAFEANVRYRLMCRIVYGDTEWTGL